VSFFGFQVIAVVLAVFIHNGDGRALTSTSNDNIERMLDLAEEELNMVSNEEIQNPADVLRLSEADSPSHEAVQSQFSDDVSGESANKGSGHVILPIEADPTWRHKRFLDDEPECYTGTYKATDLVHANITITYPKCRKVARFTACSSSKANYGNTRKCVPSHYVVYTQDNAKIPIDKLLLCCPRCISNIIVNYHHFLYH